MGKKVVVLVDEEALSKRAPRAPLIAYALLTAFVAGVAAGVTYVVFPKTPSRLTPVEAAQILRSQQGFAGYTLVGEGEGNGAVRHAIFCPYCANEIAAVNVVFMPEAKPHLGSRTAILADLAKPVKTAQAKTAYPAVATLR